MKQYITVQLVILMVSYTNDIRKYSENMAPSAMLLNFCCYSHQ